MNRRGRNASTRRACCAPGSRCCRRPARAAGRAVPRSKRRNVPGAVGIREVRRHPRADPHRLLPFGERPGPHHVQELLACAKLAIPRRFHHVDLAVRPVDHRAERRREELARLARQRVAVPELHCHQLARQRNRCPFEQVMVDRSRVGIQRVHLVQILCVVRRGPAQVLVEAANHRERATNAEVAVEIEDPGNRQVRLVVAGVPVEVRIAQQDRLARLRAARSQCPGVRPDVVRRIRDRPRVGRPSTSVAEWRCIRDMKPGSTVPVPAHISAAMS